MRIFFDISGDAPKGWLHARWAIDVIETLGGCEVTHLDLGSGDSSHGTCIEILTFLLKRASENKPPPLIVLHHHSVEAQNLMLKVYNTYASKSLNPLWVLIGRVQRRKTRKILQNGNSCL